MYLNCSRKTLTDSVSIGVAEHNASYRHIQSIIESVYSLSEMHANLKSHADNCIL